MNLSFRPQNIAPEDKPIQIILASQSIGRKSLLEKLGIPFRMLLSNCNEEDIVDHDPVKMIKRRATAKAEELVKNQRMYAIPQEGRILIIAADSMAILGTKTFGKSPDKEITKEMLKSLMGKTHQFVTAINAQLLFNGKVKKSWESVTKTKVTMRKMTGPELESYASRYDFTRFAAAYSLNETPWNLITKIDGSYTNVIGLPFEELLPILRKLEIIV